MQFDEKMRLLIDWSRRSLREVADELHLPTTTVSNWVNAGVRPRRDKLDSIVGWVEREFGIQPEIGDFINNDVSLKWKAGRPVFVEQASMHEPFDGKPRYIRGGIDGLEMCELPILGRIPAGGLNEMAEETIGTQIVPKQWSGGIERCFVLRVWGDSMYPTLRDGELIVCDGARAPFPRDGQIVVARYHGEATVKEFLRQDTKVLLIPHNRDYPTIACRPDEVEIVAVVVGRWQSMPYV